MQFSCSTNRHFAFEINRSTGNSSQTESGTMQNDRRMVYGGGGVVVGGWVGYGGVEAASGNQPCVDCQSLFSLLRATLSFCTSNRFKENFLYIDLYTSAVWFSKEKTRHLPVNSLPITLSLTLTLTCS